jgi:hypothetical protein
MANWDPTDDELSAECVRLLEEFTGNPQIPKPFKVLRFLLFLLKMAEKTTKSIFICLKMKKNSLANEPVYTRCVQLPNERRKVGVDTVLQAIENYRHFYKI